MKNGAPDDHRAIGEPSYPFRDLVGFDLIEWAPGRCLIHLPIHDGLRNRVGLPHGGVHATLLDTAMGYAGCYSDTDRITGLTLTLNISYLSRPRGALLIAEGWKTGGGRTVFFAEGVVTDDTGEKIATATGAFKYRPSR